MYIGATVGDAVGEPVGVPDGKAVGDTVGDGVGFLVGKGVGLPVVKGVGFLVGEGVGLLLGEDVGLLVGEGEGSSVGEPVGEAIGEAVGDSVGDAVGERVGLPVGAGGTVPGPMQRARNVTAPDLERFTFNCETLSKSIRTVCTELSPTSGTSIVFVCSWPDSSSYVTMMVTPSSSMSIRPIAYTVSTLEAKSNVMIPPRSLSSGCSVLLSWMISTLP
jgi:hypothetical protein